MVLPGRQPFHTGRLADLTDPEQRARQAFEQAFKIDSLYGGPIQHMSRLAFVTGDTAAQRVWTARQFALDSTAENVPLAEWDMLQSRRDAGGITRLLSQLKSQPVLLTQSILFQNPLDSVTIAHQPELMDAFHSLAVSRGDRTEMALMHVITLLNRGRPLEAAKWADSLYSISPSNANIAGAAALYYGGILPDSSLLTDDLRDFIRFSHGDPAATQRTLAFERAKVGGGLAPELLVPLATGDRSDAGGSATRSGCRAQGGLGRFAVARPAGNVEFATIQLARLYQAQGRIDRALRAIRRRYSSNGEPNPLGWPNRCDWRGCSPPKWVTRSAPSGPTGIISRCEWTPSHP